MQQMLRWMQQYLQPVWILFADAFIGQSPRRFAAHRLDAQESDSPGFQMCCDSKFWMLNRFAASCLPLYQRPSKTQTNFHRCCGCCIWCWWRGVEACISCKFGLFGGCSKPSLVPEEPIEQFALTESYVPPKVLEVHNVRVDWSWLWCIGLLQCNPGWQD